MFVIIISDAINTASILILMQRVCHRKRESRAAEDKLSFLFQPHTSAANLTEGGELFQEVTCCGESKPADCRHGARLTFLLFVHVRIKNKYQRGIWLFEVENMTET